ncbi:hypothetical protein [Streptomyces cupreus]|uniref:Uncharacterized protein n=1 Tax=Streptomyces cupreus TaxID=2759956 RepID=A0A7X1M8A3_9ACTN|nr:hypothetical protein [Streptomyces cupreus]MBC2901358.1 hypothetical protein [Streptomyces cupreus]
MALSAVLPGAALRILRTAAGRRALYLALLLGGLFALGVLGGQQAQAAEDTPTALSVDVRTQVERVAESVVQERPVQEPQVQESPVQEPVLPRPSAPEAVDGDGILRPVTEHILPAVGEHIVPAVGERVVRPVGEVVGAVTDGLDEARAKVPPLESLPTLPGLSPSPGAGLPVLPGLPELPVLPEQTLPAPDATAPQPGPVASSPGGEEDSEGPAKKATTHAHGPRGITSYDTTPPRTSAHPHRAESPAPARRAPADDPGGALDHQAAVDNGTPRHGDAHAVALNHRAPLRLVPGSAARVSADETRDEYRDIPVSPA